jgi:PAS domain S-box-containing protein
MVTNAGFLAALLLLGFIGFMSYRGISLLATNNEWVVHTHEVLEQLQTVSLELISIQSGFRGYLVTGNKNFMPRYNEGAETLEIALKRVRELTRDNTDQQQRLNMLQPSVTEVLGIMGDNVSGVSSANRQFDRTASVDNGREAMKRTQSIIATMTGEENRLLKERNEAMRSSSRLAMTVIVGGALFALLVIGSATRIINTDLTERERQAALIDQTHDAVLAWDWNGPITFWNRGAERLYGFSRAEAVGQVSHDLLRTRAQGGVETFIHSLEREGMWDGEVEHTTRDGRPITVETRMVFVREGGDYVIEVNRDITERKRAEEGMKKLNQDLERRSGELEAINKELDAFTYSVSHDLRAPLRHLDGFSKILLEEYGVQLPADAQHHLKRIREAASNMGLLVDGLLHLAHLGRTEPTLQLVGLNSIVEKVVRDLSPETTQNRVANRYTPICRMRRHSPGECFCEFAVECDQIYPPTATR